MKWGIFGNGNVVQTKSGGAFEDKVIWTDDITPEKFVRSVGAVYIATPPSSHLGYARIAVEARRPTLVEKPMALDDIEAGVMVSLFEQAEVPLFVAYYRRCLPRFQKIKEILESGAIGEVRFTHIIHTMRPQDHPVAPVIKGEPLPWRYRKEINGGGNFVDMGTHHLDLLDYFFGPIEFLHGEATNTGGLYEVEDTVFASLKCGQVNVTGQWCYAAGNNEDTFKIVGSKGYVGFSVFPPSDNIKLVTRVGNIQETKFIEEPFPKWAHAPLVSAVEEELSGGNKCPTNGENGLRAMLIQGKILGTP